MGPVRSALCWRKSSRPLVKLLIGGSCTTAPPNAKPNSNCASPSSKPNYVCGNSNSAAARRKRHRPPSHNSPGRQPQQAPPSGRVVSNAVSRGMAGAITAICPPTSKMRNLPATTVAVPNVNDPLSPSVVRKIRPFWRSRFAPHRRVVRRHRYRPACSCGVVPKVLAAPPPPRLIAKSMLGVSIWVTVLLDKYLFYRPTYRLLDDLSAVMDWICRWAP